MRVLFLNRAYPPDVAATGQLVAELCDDLAPDHETAVLCGRPNFGQLNGRVFPFRQERWRVAETWRAWGTNWSKGIPLGRIINQASFYGMASLAARNIPAPDVVVSLTDPPFMGLLGLHLKKRHRIPFVYWCMDLYPDVAQAVNMAPGPLAATFERVQTKILGGADCVIALADDMADRLVHKGVEPARLTVIRNWADTENIRPIKHGNRFRTEHGLEGKFVAMYSGNFGYVWDLDSIVEAAARLRDRRDIAFVLVGEGSTRPMIEGRVKSEGLENVRLLPYAPKGRLAESLSAADVHLVPMRRGVYGTVVPSKLYGILASGTAMAVLAESDSEAARVVREHNCGWRAAPGDARALSEFIVDAASRLEDTRSMGERARDAAVRYYARQGQTARFEELLVSSLADERRPEAAGASQKGR